MDKYDSKKKRGREIPKDSRARVDINKDLKSLKSQVEIISDTLLACGQLSKYGLSRKRFERVSQSTLELDRKRTSFVGIAPTVSYLFKERTPKHRRKHSDRQIKSDSTDSCLSHKFSSKPVRSFNACGEVQEPSKRKSKVETSECLEVDTIRLIEFIQRELQLLMDLVPEVVLTAVPLSDCMFHCKGCYSCHAKISPSLPWILNRIQRLNQFITAKRGIDYQFIEYDYYSRLASEPTVKEPEEVITSFYPSTVSARCSPIVLEEPPRELGKSEQIDVGAEKRPGFQVLLKVLPERHKKKYFDQQAEGAVKAYSEQYPVVTLTEHNSASVVQILRSNPTPIVVWDLKTEIFAPVCANNAHRLILASPKNHPLTYLICVPYTRLRTFAKAKSSFFLKPIEPCEEQFLRSRQTPVTVFHLQVQKEKEVVEPKVNEKRVTSPWNILENASSDVLELLREAEEERMQMQKVRELELEVKGLKDMMLEVHKNQMELSKLLLEKGVYSQPIIKLTDPNMLEEESKVVRRAAEVEKRTSSVETLQATVNHLKRKCALKNRMIMTLLNGLRSNVPKEWWEEIANATFDESTPMEDFDSDKISEFIRQTSIFLMNNEKVNRNVQSSSRTDEHTSDGTEIVAFPATIKTDNSRVAVRILENQVLLLNLENEKLWHEIQELKDMLQTSANRLQKRKLSGQQYTDIIKTSGKTINLTIHVASGSRRFDETKPTDLDSDSKNLNMGHASSSHEEKSKKATREHNLTIVSSKPKFIVQSSRRHSENDLNYVDDISNTSPIRRNTKKTPIQQIMLTTPRYGTLKPVFSKHKIPEACRSRSSRNATAISESPSVIKLAESPQMFATMTSERELHTIPENESALPSPLISSRSINEAIQRLRTRVRSIHNEVSVIKSKNDRFAELLEKLMEDTVENNRSLEELEEGVSSEKDRLG